MDASAARGLPQAARLGRRCCGVARYWRATGPPVACVREQLGSGSVRGRTRISWRLFYAMMRHRRHPDTARGWCIIAPVVAITVA